MNPTDVIERKRDGSRLKPDEVREFFLAYHRGEVAEYQMSAFLMAVVFNGLDLSELEALLDVMIHSGATLDLGHLPGPRADKHSTGGVGDKVSLTLAPLAAELGMYVPMMSGRGLGHTGGTLDKLEAIPGFRTDLDLESFTRVVEDVGYGMIGQTAEIAPIDRRTYDLRSVTGTVPCIPLIASSILSKKLAEDLDVLLLDVKVGDGAFIADREMSDRLAQVMVDLADARGVRTVALQTAMDRPLGVAVGNGLETDEAIATLKGGGPADFRALVVREAAEMAALALGEPGSGAAVESSLDAAVAEWSDRAESLLDSGAAFECFLRNVEAQGGDRASCEAEGPIAPAPVVREVVATSGGVVKHVAPRTLGQGVVALGGGRTKLGEAIDPSVGFEILVEPGTEVEPGTPLGRVHAASDDDAARGETILRDAIALGEGAPERLRLVVGRVSPSGS
ncbi:MAG TPA: thymidine phosphorylase [Longimicrobiales bacterium]|nr:thymidine phosphorylase [Longimicrobiales bacterium]